MLPTKVYPTRLGRGDRRTIRTIPGQRVVCVFRRKSQPGQLSSARRAADEVPGTILFLEEKSKFIENLRWKAIRPSISLASRTPSRLLEEMNSPLVSKPQGSSWPPGRVGVLLLLKTSRASARGPLMADLGNSIITLNWHPDDTDTMRPQVDPLYARVVLQQRLPPEEGAESALMLAASEVNNHQIVRFTLSFGGKTLRDIRWDQQCLRILSNHSHTGRISAALTAISHRRETTA